MSVVRSVVHALATLAAVFSATFCTNAQKKGAGNGAAGVLSHSKSRWPVDFL